MCANPNLFIRKLKDSLIISDYILFCFKDKRTRYFSKKYTRTHPTWSNGLLLRKLWAWKVFWDFPWRIWYSRSNLEQWNEVNSQSIVCILESLPFAKRQVWFWLLKTAFTSCVIWSYNSHWCQIRWWGRKLFSIPWFDKLLSLIELYVRGEFFITTAS